MYKQIITALALMAVITGLLAATTPAMAFLWSNYQNHNGLSANGLPGTNANGVDGSATGSNGGVGGAGGAGGRRKRRNEYVPITLFFN